MSTKPPSNEQWIERLSIRNACRTHSAAFAGAAVLLLASCHQSEPPSEKAATPTPSAIETPAQPPRSQAASGSQSTGGSVTRTAPAGPRLVVLYSTCTLNKNHLSPYNRDVDFTPHLDAFADNSLVFERHQTEAGQSGVAYASLFTGVQADKHGVYYHPTPLRDDLYLISEAFADAGYEVFFWSGHGMAASDLNYGQGVPSANVMETMLLGIDPKFQQILERLEREPDYKAFVMTTFSVTHSHYNFRAGVLPAFLEEYPHALDDLGDEQFETYRQIFLNNLFELTYDFPSLVEAKQLNGVDIAKLSATVEIMYRACVHSLDQLFGGLMEAVEKHGLLDDSLIAFTADHGELLYRKNALFPWTHGYQLAPEVLGVPFIVYAGDRVEAGAYENVTRSIDVFPTLAGLCNFKLRAEREIDGVDVLALAERVATSDDLLAYSHTAMRSPIGLNKSGDRYFDQFFPDSDPELMWVRIRDGDTAYKWRNLDGTEWGYEVFDLQSDPRETHNLYDPSIRAHREFARRLSDYKTRLVDAYHSPSPLSKSREEVMQQRLKSLGYVE